MEEVTSYLTSRLHRETLRYAVGRAFTCPHCGEILDVEGAVLLSEEGGGKHAHHVLCARCWGNAPWSGKSGAVEVIDGRTLWEPRNKRRSWRAAA